MFRTFFDALPGGWIGSLGQTVVTLGVAFVIGLALRDLLVARLVRMASRTPGAWDDILISEVRKRVPLWFLLAGAAISLGHWNWPKEPNGATPGRDLAAQILYAITIASVTLTMSS